MESCLKIDILVDNPNSWIWPWIEKLSKTFKSQGHKVNLYKNMLELGAGDIAFFLSCDKIVPENILVLHRHNIVVHPSRLPEGRGFSPVAWQILDNKNEIVISLLEAVKDVDSGPIYLQSTMRLEGHELNYEIKERQGEITVVLCERFINAYPDILPLQCEEDVEPSYYKRRGKNDSKLCLTSSLGEQFNLMRVADNERYPLYFINHGHKYILKVYKDEVSK